MEQKSCSTYCCCVELNRHKGRSRKEDLIGTRVDRERRANEMNYWLDAIKLVHIHTLNVHADTNMKQNNLLRPANQYNRTVSAKLNSQLKGVNAWWTYQSKTNLR